MPEDKQNNGYDYEPEFGADKYLSVKKKGQEVTIRLVSTPKHKSKHWIMGDTGKKSPINCTEDQGCPWCGADVPKDEKVAKNELFGWIVLDRSDGVVKMFSGPTLVYKKVKALLNDPDWGDPLNYDVKIKRVEDPGDGYYSVIPVPRGMGPITEAEKALVDACAINLSEELEGGKDTKSFKDKKDVSLETVGFGDDENVKTEDPTNTDDLPF